MQGILKDLTRFISRLPGLGSRGAKRIALTLAERRNDMLPIFIDILTKFKSTIRNCEECNNLTQSEICEICNDISRDKNQVCIVATVSDLWAIEKTGQYEGVYFVLGENSESLSNFNSEQIMKMEKLVEKLKETETKKECIIAIGPTIKGQTMVHYLIKLLEKEENVSTYSLSLGIPMGAELDYLDEGTIAMAMAARKEVS